MLTESLIGLSSNSHEIMKAMQDVNFMAKSVKAKAIDVKDYILI